MKKLAFLISVILILLYIFGRIIDLSFLNIFLFFWVPACILLLGAFYWFRNIYFFRDPNRTPPNKNNIILSPADGRVMYIYPIENGKVISNKNGENINIEEISKTKVAGQNGWLIGVYMSPFDVHYNYSPVEGNVKSIFHYQTNLNLPMVDLWEYINFILLKKAVNLFSSKFHLINERMTIEIENKDFSCVLILIADKFVNKITQYFNMGDYLTAGQKLSFIARGSQADLFIPKEQLKFKIAVGQQVYGCKTILAEYE